ncbi:hypothetical protein OG883_25835 [Streptomyces sp. NBC_01142]|uniref:hypothetical protein n=1 Tax=Streptomyces sp. NBC_01142 TaxID=2975865 RepID=UPI002256AEDC|nr:hypothetical protein [Streptomyces sp. NBC_01142]MCX4823245.1 hypothetical protein [Streptomyces sp. NBC_01142]
MGAVSALVLVLAVVLAVALTAGCQQATGHVGAGSSIQSVTPAATGYGLVFLGPGDCGSRGSEFREVPCTSEKAAARVIARYDGRRAAGPECPAATDFVLHVSENRPAADENGDGKVGQGYACMRNLEPPHPGDPGGPYTVVGDCVYEAGQGQVKETACDGSGARDPQFTVASAVRGRTQCPSSTALYVQLGGERPVGCARRV